MKDLTPDEILGGLRDLVARSEAAAEAAENPVPLAYEGPPAPARAPHLPPASRRPGHARQTAANAPVPPVAVRFKGL